MFRIWVKVEVLRSLEKFNVPLNFLHSTNEKMLFMNYLNDKDR